MTKELDKSDAAAPESVPSGKKKTRLIAQRYQVVNQFVGGMGIVYLCRDLQTNEAVALKTFKPEYLSHRTARDLFLREGTMWVELGRHPHIVNAYRVERIGDGREVYLVLEWVVQPQGKANPSLRAWLRPGRPLPLKESLLFALHTARGMQYATSVMPGLVHRDIKPENILIGHDLTAKVTDFGLASTLSGMQTEDVSVPGTKEFSGRTQLTQGVAGTPLYMAPEQWRHQGLDERADIYALGCILYEMVVGQFAAMGADRDELKDVHLNGRIKPPPADTPQEVAAFLRKCMATDRGDRFRSWRDVVAALALVYERVFAEAPPEARSNELETAAERIALGQSYNTMGLSYYDIGKLDVAVMYFEQAVWFGRNEGDRDLEGAGLGNLGRAYTAMGYFERALDFHGEHLAIARERHDLAQQSRALTNMGNVYRQLGDTERAVVYHQQALELARRISDGFREAAALDHLGSTFLQMGDGAQAELLYKQSLALARRIGDQSRIKSILDNMGQIYLAAGNTKEAAVLFQQALDLSRKIGDRVGEGQTLARLGQLYQRLGYTSKTFDIYRRALAISQESNDLRRAVGLHLRLGQLHLAASRTAVAPRERDDQLAEALLAFEAALMAAEHVGDEPQAMQAYVALADATVKSGDSMQAASLYKRALVMARSLHRPELEKELLQKLARAYEQWGDFGRATSYFQEAAQMLADQNDQVGLMRVWHQLGEISYRQRQLKQARQQFEQMIVFARAANHIVGQIAALNRIGDVLIELNDANEAMDCYRLACDLAKENQQMKAQVRSMVNVARAYDAQNKRWQAGRQMDKALSLAIQFADGHTLTWVYDWQAQLALNQGKWDKAREAAEQAMLNYHEAGQEDKVAEMAALLEQIETGQRGSWSGFLSPNP